MNRARGMWIDVARWRLFIPESSRAQASHFREQLADEIVAAVEGQRGAPFRRSRHATTWKVRVGEAGGETTYVFVKQLDAARGVVARAKAILRRKRSEHVLRIAGDLRSRNLGAPEVLLIGMQRDSGDEVIVTSPAPGSMLTRWMNPVHHTEVKLRRRMLHTVGTEIARLHLHGYIHGDLTPYNIFATDGHPAAITFIDHEATKKRSRVSINLARNRMRNLVQLGHFDIPGVSRTDKFRVFASYAAAAGLSERATRQTLVRVLKMIERRRKRDSIAARETAQTAIVAEGSTARG